MTAKYLGSLQLHVLRQLAEEDRPRTASQLMGSRYGDAARHSLRRLANRGLVAEHQGWAGQTFQLTAAGREWLELYR